MVSVTITSELPLFCLPISMQALHFEWRAAGFFNGLLRKRAKASRYCLHFLVKQNLFERSNWVNLHGAARLRNNFCQEKNYITFKNSSCSC